MTDTTKTDNTTEKSGRGFKRICLVLLVIVVIAGVIAWKVIMSDSRLIDEQFAAIDARLAIPDEKNAAIYYRRFFADPNNLIILDDLSDYSPSARRDPWSDDEDPELAAKFKKHRPLMQTLLDISQVKDARFPVNSEPGTDWWNMLSDFRRVTFILSCAAANDLAEGRTDAALDKYQCQLKMARQLQQQPVTWYNLVGMAIEGAASWNIRNFIMRDETTPGQLNSLETILKIPVNRVEDHAEIVSRVEQLTEQKEWSQLLLNEKLKRLLNNRKIRLKKSEQKKRMRLINLRVESTRKATLILIALRRHKDKTGTWPESLEEIEPKLPSQMLIDPQNDGPYVYKLEGDSFVFYSKGPNKTDEKSSSKSPADDYQIWPGK